MVFYWLNTSSSHLSRRHGYGSFEDIKERSGGFGGTPPTCRHCGTKIGHLFWQPPYVVRFTPGKRGDICTNGISILLSERFKEAWEESGLRGMIVEKLVGCNKCRVVRRSEVQRLRIDESTWSGEAAFYPSGLFGKLLVTQDFVDLVYKHRFGNFILVHQDDFHEPYILMHRAVKYLKMPKVP